MYELIQLSEHDFYVDCPSKMGLVQTGEHEAVAIDSGNDKDAGKKLLRHAEQRGWTLTAVYNTHSHADHIGGNRLLQERTNCRVYARGLERTFTEQPLLEPMCLFGGLPPAELRHKFLMAQASRAEELTAACLPAGWELLELPGHSFDMVGFRTADGNVFLADCLSSEPTLEKYGLGYLWDPEAYVGTLERVKTMEAMNFVPAHAPVTAEIAPLAQKNIDAVKKAEETVVSLCREAKEFEQILGGLFETYGLAMDLTQYALLGSTLRSYLASLKARGRMRVAVDNTRVLWQSV